jgi:hypothetical protein
MTTEINDIKEEHFDRLRNAEVFMVERTDSGRLRIEHWTPDGVAPQSDYADEYDAAARLLQLMGIKRPVYPQDWPESVRISAA